MKPSYIPTNRNVRPPGISKHNNTKVVSVFLAVESTEETLNGPKKTTVCLWSLGSVASEVVCGDENPVSGLEEQESGCQMFTRFCELFALSAERQSAHNPPRQDYRDKIEPEWILHSSNGDLWTNFWALNNF